MHAAIHLQLESCLCYFSAIVRLYPHTLGLTAIQAAVLAVRVDHCTFVQARPL